MPPPNMAAQIAMFFELGINNILKILNKYDHKQRARRDLNPRPNAPQALTLSILSHEPNNLLGKIVKNVWKRTMLLFQLV